MKPRCPWPHGIAVLTVLSYLALSGCYIQMDGCSQANYRRSVTQTVACSAGSTLDVATSSGSITVTGADANECRVLAEIVAHAPTEEEAQQLAEQVEIRATPEGDTVKIRADQPHLANNRSISISYQITAPRRQNLLCHSDYGGLTTTDLVGTVKAKTTSGSIKAERIEGPTDLDTSYGSIECRTLAGPTTLLRSSSGSLTAADLQGEAKLVTSYGSITCDTFTGSTLDLKTDSGRLALANASFKTCLAVTSYGSVTCHDLKGDALKVRSNSGSLDLATVDSPSLDASTSYGNIKARDITTAKLLAASGSGSVTIVCTPTTPADLTAEVKSSYGSIDFTAPPGFTGSVDLHTNYGSIHTALPVTVSGAIDKTNVTGKVGAGAGLLRLHTGSGSINLK